MSEQNIEIITVRNPDSVTEVYAFINGERVEAREFSIDPGAGYELSDWIEKRGREMANASPAAATVLRDAFDEYLESRFLIDNYADVLDTIAHTYDADVKLLLEGIRQKLLSVGIDTDGRAAHMWDDNYRWTLATLNGEEKVADGSADFMISIAEQRDNDGGLEFGINWMLDVTGYDGTILGGVAPFNYTENVWVPAYTDEAVRERFDLLRSAIEQMDTETLRDIVVRAQNSPNEHV